MATDLDTLIALEEGQKDTLVKDIATGVAAQGRLAQVQAVLADLSATASRRKSVLDGADARVADAKAKAAEVTAGLAPVDAMLADLPGALTLADLDSIVAADLPNPPDAAKKKYAQYVSAFIGVDKALGVAVVKAVQAGDAAALARIAIDRAEAALQVAVDQVALAAAGAKAALADALSARGTGDFARAYWHELRVKELIAAVNDPAAATAIADAKLALQGAVNAYADATDLRLKAEVEVASKQADRSKAADQLGEAAGQVLKQLSDAVAAAKAGP